MSFFEDSEKEELGKGLAKLLGVTFEGPEQDTAEQIDAALALGKKYVDAGMWTHQHAEHHLASVQATATAAHAAARKLQEMMVNKALVDILFVFAGVINARIGFPILPEE